MKKIQQITFGQGIKLPASKLHAGSITWDDKNLRAYYDHNEKTVLVFQRKGTDWFMSVVFETNVAGILFQDNKYTLDEVEQIVGSKTPKQVHEAEVKLDGEPKKKPGRKPGFKVAAANGTA